VVGDPAYVRHVTNCGKFVQIGKRGVLVEWLAVAALLAIAEAQPSRLWQRSGLAQEAPLHGPVGSGRPVHPHPEMSGNVHGGCHPVSYQDKSW